LKIGHYCPNILAVNGKEFIRRARKWAKANGLPISVDAARGKGGHQLLKVGDFRTTVKTGEIGEGLLNAMLGQLGIPKKGF
jgi:mRNA interferase HicA